MLHTKKTKISIIVWINAKPIYKNPWDFGRPDDGDQGPSSHLFSFWRTRRWWPLDQLICTLVCMATVYVSVGLEYSY